MHYFFPEGETLLWVGLEALAYTEKFYTDLIFNIVQFRLRPISDLYKNGADYFRVLAA